MTTGDDLLELAETRLGEKYDNVLVPKDNPNWHGPWDCAEFASWVVYQKIERLYECTNNQSTPAKAESYSGSWVRDALDGTLSLTDKAFANTAAGVILIRKPPMAGKMGHIAISDGKGGTVEAAGKNLNVRRDKIEGRVWHHYALIPNITYTSSGKVINPKPLPFLLTLEDPYISLPIVKDVQRALEQAGFNPGEIDGEYGPHTVAAVFAFQRANKLVADGIVGPLTAKKLKVTWQS